MKQFPNYPLEEHWFPQEGFSELTMHHFGRHHCPANYSVGPREMMIKEHYLFHYIISGRGVLRSTDDSGMMHEYFLDAGQGFMIWPGQPCQYVSDEKEPWEYAWVEFDGSKAKELLFETGLEYNHPVYVSQNARKQDIMLSELLWIVHNAKESPLELMGHFYVFLSNLISSSSRFSRAQSPVAGNQEMHFRKAVDYLMRYYNRDLTIQEIADHCGVHRSYLFQIFRTFFGFSPLQFLIQYRIKKACELLRTTNLPVGEISVKVGYPNQMNFVRAFKRLTGSTPLKWRKTGNKY